MRISDWSSDVCSSDLSYGGRASLLWKPDSRLSVRLSALLQNLSVDGAPSFVETDPATLKPLYGGLTRSEYVPSFSNVKYRLYNGTIDYDVGFATLPSELGRASWWDRVCPHV